MKKHWWIPEEKEGRRAWWVLAVVGIFRLWYCTYNDLVGDEAYYWLWSKHLDASYFSKGPAVAWTIAFGTWIAGDNSFGVRWLSVLLSVGTGWQIYWLARRLFTPEVGFWAVTVAAITPIFAAGSVLMTIDPLSVFFWIWSINLFLDALGASSGWRWVAVGFAIGCGFLSKYTNALEWLSFAWFLSCSRAHRTGRNWRGFAGAMVVFLFMTLPVVIWNSQHHWITVAHLRDGGRLNETFWIRPSEFLKFLLNQTLVFSPGIFVGILWAVLARRWRAGTWHEILLLGLFWPIFGMYALLSLHEAANPNWPALAYLSGLILAVSFWIHAWRRSTWGPWFCRIALGVAALMTLLFHETSPLLPFLHKDPLGRARGWAQWGKDLETFRQQVHPDYLIANDYATASLLSFYLPGHPQTFIPDTGFVQNQFSFWPSYSHEPGRKALYITDDPIPTLPGLLPHEFPHAQPIGQIQRTFRGRPIEHYRIWVLE